MSLSTKVEFYCDCKAPVCVSPDEGKLLMQHRADGNLYPCCPTCYNKDIDMWWFDVQSVQEVPMQCAKCHTSTETLYHPAMLAIRAEWIHCRACLKPDPNYKTDVAGCFFAKFDGWPLVSTPNMVPIE